ncbi:CCDC90 family protein [Aspergillus undulatus]|uniref:CCDC90 family protein n=1 Tax=Aspergillus undulatus TaxID=1810928 RepID=UPI003CCDF84C
MASPRLPFLYPNLMRAVKSCEPSTYRSLHVPTTTVPARPTWTSRASFHTSRRRAQGSIQRRYGPAVEPSIPPPSKPRGETAADKAQDSNSDSSLEKKNNAPSAPEESEQPRNTAEASNATTPQPEPEKSVQPAEQKPLNENEELDEEEGEEEGGRETLTPESLEAKQPPSSEDQPTEDPRKKAPILDGNPLEGVLHMPSPSSYLTPTTSPHMAPPPYVHHFDTYTLVQDLAKGGFSDAQSITIMKAVRKILQNNLDFAKQNLTSKSDVENETYLFKAACSELQSSLQTARNSEVQRQRASRTSLEHEADILSQRTNQELSGMKDDIKGMFNDHKMTVRELQRSIDTSVQEINYKITVSLNSDSKSEIEGLRWILTRRAALAIATSAFMILVFLRYSSTQRAQNGTEKKKDAPAKESPEPSKTAEVPPPPHPQDEIPVTAHFSESMG